MPYKWNALEIKYFNNEMLYKGNALQITCFIKEMLYKGNASTFKCNAFMFQGRKIQENWHSVYFFEYKKQSCSANII